MLPLALQAVLTALGAGIANQLPQQLQQNTSVASNATMASTPVIPTSLSDISSLLTFILSLNGLGDWLKLFILGGLVESARRLIIAAYNSFLESFLITVHFEGNDLPYSWLMFWLSKQESWTKARTLQISSETFGLGSAGGYIVPGEDARGKEGGRPLSLLPSWDATHSIWFKKRLMRVTRSKKYLGEGQVEYSLSIQIYTRSHKTIHDLLLEAKREYESATESRVSVYVCDQYNNWYYAGSRPKRSMDSVVIPEEVKELLVEDAKDFMDSEAWYGQRGIPWQRGWLLYGVPGSGKTSIIQALAGELGINIYVVSLAKRGLDDGNLSELINSIPSRSIILMEDIDAAFSTSLNREAPVKTTGFGPVPSNPSSVTLSGLLNAIDGVQAQQGRLLFATTNKYLSLDPALVRPGRLDVHIEFSYASKWQAAELFKRFYPVDVDAPEHPIEVENIEDTGDAVEKASQVSGLSNDTKSPKLSTSQLDALAHAFAAVIPEEEISMAALQGHLMLYKTRPHEAVRATPDFVIKEKERQARAAVVAAEKEER
ncbi:uncharacterized protein EI90DRAFT_2997066, partial [Cantharellus anzutake]|uniref:uncharacterized protein n=1 Tax=Cantharellus anzutake TaxID=1750568 RepID=UPI00190587EC